MNQLQKQQENFILNNSGSEFQPLLCPNTQAILLKQEQQKIAKIGIILKWNQLLNATTSLQ